MADGARTAVKTSEGLSSAKALRRLREVGPNEPAHLRAGWASWQVEAVKRRVLRRVWRDGRDADDR